MNEEMPETPPPPAAPPKANVKLAAIGIALVLVAGAFAAGYYLGSRPAGNPPGSSAPASPGGVRGEAGPGSLTVQWDPVTGADGYNLYLASAPGVRRDNYASMPGGQRLANVASPYTITGLEEGRTFYVRVTAFNAAGESAR